MKVGDLTQLEIDFTNINALRATEPSAAQNKNNACPNSPKGYRDGALVIRVTSATGEPDQGKVLHETALYEHLKKDTLIAPYNTTAQIGCGKDGDSYRQYKDPTKFTGSTAGSSGTGSGVTVGGGGTVSASPAARYRPRRVHRYRSRPAQLERIDHLLSW